MQTLTKEEISRYQKNLDAGSFERESLTSSDNPYTRLPARRKVSPKIRKKAEYAMSYLLLEGHGTNARIVICQSTPQWVADVVNRCSDKNGVVDQWRQKLIYESLKMISSGAPPSVANADNIDKLRKWEHSTNDKRRYVRRARSMLDSPSEKELLQLAQRLERFEVYFQVFTQLQEMPYDGSLYDPERVRRAHHSSLEDIT